MFYQKKKKNHPDIFSGSSSFPNTNSIPQPIFPPALSFNVLPQKTSRVKKDIIEFSSIILSPSNIFKLVYIPASWLKPAVLLLMPLQVAACTDSWKGECHDLLNSLLTFSLWFSFCRVFFSSIFSLLKYLIYLCFSSKVI